MVRRGTCRWSGEEHVLLALKAPGLGPVQPPVSPGGTQPVRPSPATLGSVCPRRRSGSDGGKAAGNFFLGPQGLL